VKEKTAGLRSTPWMMSSVVPVLLATGTALAQQSPDSTNRPSSNTVVLEEVVVTATKRAEDLQSVPDSVTAIGDSLLNRIQAQSLSDIAAYVPGLNVQASGVEANRLIIRGLTTGPNDLSPSVGVYIDDAPFGSNSGFALGALFSPDLDPFDLERVEVLKGPQGTLYGASTLAGLVKYVTKAPDPDSFSTHARVDFDRADDSGANTYAMRAGVNLPLISGKVALRVSGFYENSDGDTSDVRTGESGLNGSYKHGGRADLLIKPISNLSIDLIAFTDTSVSPHVGVIDGNPQTLQPTYGQYAGYDFVNAFASSSYSIYEATVRYEFANGITATSTTSYSHFAVNEQADDTSTFQPALGPVLGPLLEFSGPVQPTTLKYTEELRVASPSSDHFEWLAGIFFDRDNSSYLSAFNSTYLFGATPPAVLQPTVTALASYENVDNIEHYTEYAGFADATYYIVPQFDLSGGLRFSHNSQALTTYGSGFLALENIIPTYSADTSHDNVWTESFAARWHLLPQSILYARYATGYRPGGPTGAGQTFAPDTTRNYELGFKTTALGGALQADVAAFFIDWRDVQLNFFNGENDVIGNAGNAHSKGVELQAVYAPLKAFTIQGNAAYTDAVISSLIPGAQGGAAVGDQLPSNSKWTAGLLADYYLPLAGATRWNAGAGLRYRSSSDTTFPNDPGTRFYTLPATVFFDLRTGLNFGEHFALTFQILNVANQRRLTGAAEYLSVTKAAADAFGQPVDLTYTPGRIFGLSLSAQL
jgi:iron complex outermembrane receptor protein